MYKKFLTGLFIAFLALFSFAMNAKAQINSEYDINYKLNQLQEIAQTDFMSFINKNEMIGYRLSDYTMETQFYKNSTVALIEKMKKSINQIHIISNSADLSDTDKNVQIYNIYQDIDASLYDLDSKTINYLSNCKRSMPTLTYQRYVKKFEEFYNGFRLTNTVINVY